MTSRRRRAAQIALLAVPVVILAERSWARRWMSDDGFINLRVVSELLHGHGPVFNTGQRVEAFTSPVWLAALVVGDVLLPIRLEWVAVVLGIVTTVAGLVLAMLGAVRLHRSADEWLVPAGALVVAAIAPVWDFASSGLESGVIYAWLGGCLSVLARWARSGRSLGAGAAVLLGMGVLVRPDLGLFTVAFVALVIACQWSKESWSARTRLLAAAFALPVAYQVFRMGYYGAVVPNTALAKEASRPRWDAGWLYLRDFLGTYWLLVPVVALLLGVLLPLARAEWGDRRRRVGAVSGAFVGAAVVHAVYVVRVGGDFMHARLLLPSAFALLAPVAVVPVMPVARRVVPAVAFGVVAVWSLVALVALRPPTTAPSTSTTFVADVRASAVGLTGERHPVTVTDYGWGPGGRFVRPYDAAAAPVWAEGRPLTRAPAPGLPTPTTAAFGVGLPAYALGPDWHVVDLLGLGDAVAARMRIDDPGLIGHEKPLPRAWVVAETVAPGGRFAVDAVPRPVLARPLYESPRGGLGVDVAAARAARACGDLAALRRATEARLTVSRFADNLFGAISRSNLRIDPDPKRARRELGCPPV